VQDFNLNEDIAYLNHAAVSPWPIRTCEAVKQFADENACNGATDYLRWMEVENTVRVQFAQLLGLSQTDEIALAKSTSEALSTIAYGINWQTNDEILICAGEFPSNRIVWESLATKSVKTKRVTINEHNVAQSLIDAAGPNTRLISVSSVQYASGLRCDLTALSTFCQKQNILLCVDAIQSLGAFEFNQPEIQADFIVADGHKWLMAPEGLALLYVKRKIISELTLHQFGWHMVEAKGDYGKSSWSPASDATRFECGSPNMLGAHALSASLSLILERGVTKISEEINSRVIYLINALETHLDCTILSPKAPEKRAGIVTFSIEGVDSEPLYKALMQAKVICANRGGGIRFSPHYYTPYTSLDLAIARLKAIINNHP
jgi:selenocysteine lyase/cysteine desulfurase